LGCLCPAAQSRTRFECGWPRGALMVIGLSRQPQNIGQTSQPGHTFQNLFKVNQLWLGPGHCLARLTSPNVRCMKYAPTWHLTCVIIALVITADLIYWHSAAPCLIFLNLIIILVTDILNAHREACGMIFEKQTTLLVFVQKTLSFDTKYCIFTPTH